MLLFVITNYTEMYLEQTPIESFQSSKTSDLPSLKVC